MVKRTASGGQRDKSKLPRRLCRDPQTKYCQGHKNSKTPWGHRGCCNCFAVNAGEEPWLDWIPGTRIPAPCEPYNLRQYWIEKGWPIVDFDCG